MRTDQLPKFSEITPKKSVAACAKLAIEYETKLENHVESLTGEWLKVGRVTDTLKAMRDRDIDSQLHTQKSSV